MPSEDDKMKDGRLNLAVTADSTGFVSFQASTGTPISYIDISESEQILSRGQQVLGIIREFKMNSEETGSYVQILKEYACCPVLIGSDAEPIFLYKFIEIIDEIIDFGRLKEELPTLTFGQLNGAISFLRKLAQFNVKFVDVDDLEDEMLMNTDQILEELRSVITEENSHVLSIA